MDPNQQQIKSGEAGTPSNDLGPCVAVLVNAVAKGMAELVAPHDLIPLEFALLRVFLGEEERTTTQLAQILPVKMSRISRVVTKMVGRGLMRRRRLSNDRRVVMLSLTEEGKALTLSFTGACRPTTPGSARALVRRRWQSSPPSPPRSWPTTPRFNPEGTVAANYAGMPNMFMLKARSRVVDVPGVVWALTRSLFIVAVMVALLVSSGVAYAQGTPTVPTIESVAVTSDPGEDGGYAIGDEIQVGLTFSEAVTVTGIPQLNLDVGGRSRTVEYSEGSTTTRLLFTYTVPSGDEDTDGIAVVANSLALNGGAIRAGSTNAALTHPALPDH